jgi:signal transduction histidine kinase
MPLRKATTQADAYIAALAHELRNPLNTLAGFLEIVLAEQVGPLNDRQREFLEYARESAARIAQVIEQKRGGGGHG